MYVFGKIIDCKRMLVSPSSLQVSELVPHQASKL